METNCDKNKKNKKKCQSLFGNILSNRRNSELGRFPIANSIDKLKEMQYLMSLKDNEDADTEKKILDIDRPIPNVNRSIV